MAPNLQIQKPMEILVGTANFFWWWPRLELHWNVFLVQAWHCRSWSICKNSSKESCGRHPDQCRGFWLGSQFHLGKGIHTYTSGLEGPCRYSTAANLRTCQLCFFLHRQPASLSHQLLKSVMSIYTDIWISSSHLVASEPRNTATASITGCCSLKWYRAFSDIRFKVCQVVVVTYSRLCQT